MRPTVDKINILAIGAHPDDIEYGCAATLSRFAEKGDNVYLHILTDGRKGGAPAARRKKEQEKSAAIMGVSEVFWSNYEDTKLPFHDTVIADIQKVVDTVKPVFVFIHDANDTHQDHRYACDCAVSATRFIPNVLFYEGPTTVHFGPNVFVNIYDRLNTKFRCLRAHRSQVMRTNIYNQSILDLAKATAIFRGEYCHQKYAEAFKSLRMMFLLP
ncbi:MAG: PIG-L family deacetylase [Chitinispirillaceae bacterium]|nr:PIG-L family deacetylase [Chitinispirillaceae bacterium]